MSLSFIRFIFLMLCISCSNKAKHQETVNSGVATQTTPKIESGRIYEALSSGGSLYSAYIPTCYKENQKYPVIIFLDPHGKGSFPIGKYKSLAEKFNFILIGSNESKNGMDFDQATKIAGDLLHEASAILPGNSQLITLAGFSGGAKAALYAGNSVPGFFSVVYCSAAFPPGSIETKVPSLAFAGNRDMNYTEVRNFNFSLVNSKLSNIFIDWNGKHEWPDSVVFSHAFYWNALHAMQNKFIAKDDKTIKDFISFVDSELDKEKNLLVKSFLFLIAIDNLDGISSTENYKSKLSALTNSPAFKTSREKQDQQLAIEDTRKTELASSFETKNLLWWATQISNLSANKTNVSNQRLLGYISLAAWSYSSKSVARNDLSMAQKALTIYKLADPTNSEQPFLSACLYSKNGMQDSAVYFIKEAVKLGLNDKNKIESEKDLYELHSRTDYQQIISQLK